MHREIFSLDLELTKTVISFNQSLLIHLIVSHNNRSSVSNIDNSVYLISRFIID